MRMVATTPLLLLRSTTLTTPSMQTMPTPPRVSSHWSTSSTTLSSSCSLATLKRISMRYFCYSLVCTLPSKPLSTRTPAVSTPSSIRF
ncbi:hypothetical protein BJ741DRAFT_602749 [Chytriomyces cf. hyalinus JEL632]|nr:hypothetical protein BJ741DRAFT_602749 [Chytriomyces cf. hyalinus JEL632]